MKRSKIYREIATKIKGQKHPSTVTMGGKIYEIHYTIDPRVNAGRPITIAVRFITDSRCEIAGIVSGRCTSIEMAIVIGKRPKKK